MLVLGSEWLERPFYWNKNNKHHERDSAPSFRTTFGFGPSSLTQKMVKSRKDRFFIANPVDTVRDDVAWFLTWIKLCCMMSGSSWPCWQQQPAVEVGFEKWWTVATGWEKNPLKPFVHLCGQINKVGKIWHRCTSLPILCPAKICTMRLRKVPLLVPHSPLSTHGCLEEMGPTSF